MADDLLERNLSEFMDENVHKRIKNARTAKAFNDNTKVISAEIFAKVTEDAYRDAFERLKLHYNAMS